MESTSFLIGIGKAEVTDPTPGANIQGFAVPEQKVAGVAMPLFSRAFIIAKNDQNMNAQNITALVVADIWSCTLAIKYEVIKRLQLIPDLKELYNEENVIISGTHTHSGTGGFSHYFLYNVTGGGFDAVNFNIIVHGIVESIKLAHRHLAPGKIYINKGEVLNCGRNRSFPAYENNPLLERKNYAYPEDKEMLLLKFTQENNGEEKPIGALNWYAIHPACLGQKNTLISGDCKGWASQQFEKAMEKELGHHNFVAAFGNSNTGDISPSVDENHKGIPHTAITDQEHVEHFGDLQFEQAKSLFNNATEELIGDINFKYNYLNMANIAIESDPTQEKRTWAAALGISFAAGSTEDGDSGIPVKEGITAKSLSVRTFELFYKWLTESMGKFESEFEIDFHHEIHNISLDNLSGRNEDFIQGHHPKPILLAVGDILGTNEKDSQGNWLLQPWVPNVVPIQLIQIGPLIIIGMPGEITTMAGRRLKATMKKTFNTEHVALANYSNEYSGYVATFEEYQLQHYEGASTLYGPHTLEAYEQEFAKLGEALIHKAEVTYTAPGLKILHWHPRSFNMKQLISILEH